MQIQNRIPTLTSFRFAGLSLPDARTAKEAVKQIFQRCGLNAATGIGFAQDGTRTVEVRVQSDSDKVIAKALLENEANLKPADYNIIVIGQIKTQKI